MTNQPSFNADRVARLITKIENKAGTAYGVNEFEGLLRDLLAQLIHADSERQAVVSQLVRLTVNWPPGAIEILEFTMHALRWPEIRAALEFHRDFGEDFRTRNLAYQALQAFDGNWPDADIYETYRG